MTARKAADCVTIQPGTYPVMSPATAFGVAKQLRNPAVQAAAARALEDGAGALRQAVQVHVDRLQEHLAKLQSAAAEGDIARIYTEAHEVRGLAGNAGLTAAGRIASELCRYLDAAVRAGVKPDLAVVQLHLEAGLRAAKTEDEATKLGAAVADNLAALVTKKIAEINEMETAARTPA
jgi:HPt (histidine-containing phosphotransfer) domain-containing protein